MCINCGKIHYVQTAFFSLVYSKANAVKEDMNAKKAAPPQTGALTLHVSLFELFFFLIRQITEFNQIFTYDSF